MKNKRLIIQSGDAAVAKYLDASQPFHEYYAEQCAADFERLDGLYPGASHPAWNRLPMILDAFDQGYEHVLWLDSDTLVVDPTVDVFEQYRSDHEGRSRVRAAGARPIFCMRRTAGGFYWPMDGPDQWEGWNDGVLLVNQVPSTASTPGSIELVRELWSKRDAMPLPHHQPTLWELNWLLDLAKAQPEVVAEMDQRFNWQPFNGSSPEQYAVIKAWHGIGHVERWQDFSRAVKLLAPIPTTEPPAWAAKP